MSDPEVERRMEYFTFGGTVVSVMKRSFNASLSLPGKDQEMFIQGLFDDYAKAGKPANVKSWIAEKLHGLFVSTGKPPHWMEVEPAWPWLNGKPMVFLKQFTIPDIEIAKTHASANTELYIFGARVPTSGGWKMEYRVIDQRSDLKGVVALVESELPPHTPANTKLVKRKDD